MPRYKLTIEYDGTNYCGWQRQADVASVQQAIETAIFAFSAEEVSISGAGRTDTGVHAKGQVAHFDLEKETDPETVQGAINAHLRQQGDQVAILSAEQVGDDFDARFSAKRRHYLYRFICRKAHLTLDYNRMLQVPHELDVDLMNEAAQRLVGRHDFTTFRSVQCQAKSPVRTLERLEVLRVEGTDLIELHASAPAFLHNQIRSFAGTLKKVGEGRWSADNVSEALEAKDRTTCGPVAPPHALYFMSVEY